MRVEIVRAKLAHVLAPMALVAFLTAGCGATGTTSTATGGIPNGKDTVSTASAAVSGQTETILTDSQARTLYYFTDDSATVSACTTGCSGVWPPLTLATGTPTSSNSLPGTLSAVNVGNGLQVLYNGHPLYRYSGDTAAGQTNGEGIEGKWHVATPGLATNSGAPAGQPTATPCSGYYGCYSGG